MNASPLDAGHNPFATRFVRPGALPYRFPPGESAASLVARLAQQQWRGEIVGPHGVGKSTLLATLIPVLAAAGRRVVSVALHGGERTLPPSLANWSSWNDLTLLVIDGYEQLSWWSRVVLAVRRGITRAGLLVTTHRSCRLPLLVQLQPRVELACELVRALGVMPEEINDATVAATFSACQGNVRETMFQLYDHYQREVERRG
jgi:hypothetical protein